MGRIPTSSVVGDVALQSTSSVSSQNYFPIPTAASVTSINHYERVLPSYADDRAHYVGVNDIGGR